MKMDDNEVDNGTMEDGDVKKDIDDKIEDDNIRGNKKNQSNEYKPSAVKVKPTHPILRKASKSPTKTCHNNK